MVPWDRLIRVQPNTDLMEALRAMDDANVAQVPVVEGNQVAGLLSREQILRYVRLRAELGV
jgi:CBS domain-containing protein